jgi:hypothetical protein
MAVIKLQMNQFAPATVPTAFEKLMKIVDTVSGKSQCPKGLQKKKVAI